MLTAIVLLLLDFYKLVLRLGHLTMMYDAWRSAVNQEEAGLDFEVYVKRSRILSLPAILNRSGTKWAGGI